MIDSIAGADSSAIIYSIAETAKANNLKPYDYFEYLLTEIPKHLDESDRSFCENLLPWSDKLPVSNRDFEERVFFLRYTFRNLLIAFGRKMTLPKSNTGLLVERPALPIRFLTDSVLLSSKRSR